jgi:hypothetical protein
MTEFLQASGERRHAWPARGPAGTGHYAPPGQERADVGHTGPRLGQGLR